MTFNKRTPKNSIWNKVKNATVYANKYKAHSEGVIVACYFNPQNSPYRKEAFDIFYKSIKHLNHRIVECVIGDSNPELFGKYISHVHTKDLLWHKESLLNKVISELPNEFKYVFWLDADIIFTNKDWFVNGVDCLGRFYNIIQPFEFCIHLDKDQAKPSFDYESDKKYVFDVDFRNKKMWRSFSANAASGYGTLAKNENYDLHGHVGFAWGARREILETIPLYDKALIGGADHIIAHASAGHICHSCIEKSFTETLDEINDWSKMFSNVINGRIGYVKGDLFHIWHGDVEKRQYLKRIQDFTPKTKNITQKDENGLYVYEDDEAKEYMKNYFSHREVSNKKTKQVSKLTSREKKSTSRVPKLTSREKNIIYNKRAEIKRQYPNENDYFLESMLISYLTNDASLGIVFGGNITGAIIGDMLNDSEQVEFGGGEFGGAGAGGSWEPNDNSITESSMPSQNSSDSISEGLVFTVSNDTENFS